MARLADAIRGKRSLAAIETGLDPRVAWSTAAISTAAVLAVVFIPRLRPFFGLSHPEVIIATAVLAATASTIGWVGIRKGDLVWSLIFDMVDTPLYALVPIQVALWSEPLGAGIGLALYGLMLVHWARLGGKSKIRLFIIVLPSLILLPRFGELPWLGLEWALSFCIYLVIVANEETLKRRNDEERAQEMVDIVADAVRGAHLAAELTTIAEARLRLHEIRNALNPASLCLGILADEIEGLSEEAREAFESIEQGIRNTSERSTAAMMQLIPSGRAEVVELQEVLEMLATLIDHSSCNLRPEIQGETADILIQGKGKVLAGCLLNLVRNAEEAEATRVTFDISPQRDHVILRVGDNGGGIAEELAPHIFQPGVTAGKPNGSGHALHIVKVILETLGGEIELDRGSERKGTVFLLRLKRTTARELDIIRAAERALLKSTPPRDLIR